jgi:hypothetical protein
VWTIGHEDLFNAFPSEVIRDGSMTHRRSTSYIWVSDTTMLVSGSYHNKIVYCSVMSQVVILSVLAVELEDVGGVGG